MKRKNILAAILIFTMLLTLAGCGNSSSNADNNENSQTTMSNQDIENGTTEEDADQKSGEKNASKSNGKTLVVGYKRNACETSNHC